MSSNPTRIFCISGKRKTGKDYVAELLRHRLPGSVVVRLSAPIKEHWAQLMGLDLNELLSDREYKEKYRLQMILWGEEKRSRDPGFFCRSAIDMSKGGEHAIWIVADLRRKSDLEFFRDHYPRRVTTVRIEASLETRASRGFSFTAGVDDAESECGLDGVTDWDLIIENDGDEAQLQSDLRKLTDSW